MSLQTIPLPGVYNTRGGLAVYGPGTDGNVIITGTVVLNRDMYYNNLTIMGGAQLDSNGYRIFVKNTLNMVDSTSIIGRLSNITNSGSILGGAPSGIKASDTLGGNGGLNPGQNFFGEAEFYNFSQAIAGYKFDAVAGTLRFLMGGSGGASGTIGTSGANGSFTAGTLGSAGQSGSAGTRPGFETTIGASGGQGYPGLSGSPGSPGVGGAGGAAGSAGQGGAGGGVVIISARNIIGSGVIRADGNGGTNGGSGGSGLPGTPGSPGAPGNNGLPAPDFYAASYTYISAPGYFYNSLYSFTNPVYSFTARGAMYNTETYNSPKISPAYNSSTTYNAPVTTYNAPTGGNANPPTPGPASVRWRPITYNPVVAGTARTTAGTARTNYVQYFYINPGNLNPSTLFYYNYTAWAGGNTSYAYNLNYAPETYSVAPQQFFKGGAGGLGGLGGVGGIGSAGLPGSPGTAGYAGGGGVVLVVTESDIPQNIDVRAAAGTGGAGMATSGTVIIIKNEAVKDGN